MTGLALTPSASEIVFTRDARGRLAGEPNWGVSANTEYTLHVGPVDSFVRALYTFQSGRTDDTVANSVFDTTSYGVFNLFLGVRDPQKVWEVTAWAKNLFDHQQIVRIGARIEQGGFASAYQGVQVIPERQIGVTGKYNFAL